MHSTVSLLGAFEANAWKKYQFLCYMSLWLPSPLPPAPPVLHTLLVIALIQLIKADFVELKSISTAECGIWINGFCV